MTSSSNAYCRHSGPSAFAYTWLSRCCRIGSFSVLSVLEAIPLRLFYHPVLSWSTSARSLRPFLCYCNYYWSCFPYCIVHDSKTKDSKYHQKAAQLWTSENLRFHHNAYFEFTKSHLDILHCSVAQNILDHVLLGYSVLFSSAGKLPVPGSAVLLGIAVAVMGLVSARLGFDLGFKGLLICLIGFGRFVIADRQCLCSSQYSVNSSLLTRLGWWRCSGRHGCRCASGGTAASAAMWRTSSRMAACSGLGASCGSLRASGQAADLRWMLSLSNWLNCLGLCDCYSDA